MTALQRVLPADMAEEVCDLTLACWAPKTEEKYGVAFNQFTQFAKVIDQDPVRLLMSEELLNPALAAWACFLKKGNKKFNTVRGKVSAMNSLANDLRSPHLLERALQALERQPEPADPRVGLPSTQVYKLVQASERLLAEYKSQHKRAATRAVREAHQETQERRAMLLQRNAAIILAYICFLRESSIESVSKVAFKEGNMLVYIDFFKKKKTGKMKAITGHLVDWFKQLWTVQVFEHKQKEPHIFHRLTGDPNAWIAAALHEYNIRPPPNKVYTFHSLRIGAATACHRPPALVEQHTLLQWGEWNTASSAKPYLRLNEPKGNMNDDKWFWGFLSPQARTGDR